MNILLSALINHFLSVAEQELIKEEPEIVQAIENELKLLVSKIENLLSTKLTSVAPVVNPLITKAETIVLSGINGAVTGINDAGNATVGIQTPQSSN